MFIYTLEGCNTTLYVLGVDGDGAGLGPDGAVRIGTPRPSINTRVRKIGNG